MTYFAPLDHGNPVRVALVGAGSMGRTWLTLLDQSPDVDLVGIVDLDPATADEAAASIGRPDLPRATSLTELSAHVVLDAAVNVTVPKAHHAVNLEALSLGLSMLCEKPIVPTVAQALDLAAAAEVHGHLLMTSQSRRYYRSLDEFRTTVATLGDIGLLTTDFHTGPHFGGFRDVMPHPLLIDMAIHAFDSARFVLSANPVSVYCEEFNPSWSWYQGDAATVAVFQMTDSSRYVYTGSWCNEGLPTSWNGQWTARGAMGSAAWDGASRPTVDSNVHVPLPDPSTREGLEEIAGALSEFVDAVRSGLIPYGDIHSNVWSLAMVEGAVESSLSGSRVLLATLLDTAYRHALEAASSPEVRDRLNSWETAQSGLAAFSTGAR